MLIYMEIRTTFDCCVKNGPELSPWIILVKLLFRQGNHYGIESAYIKDSNGILLTMPLEFLITHYV